MKYLLPLLLFAFDSVSSAQSIQVYPFSRKLMCVGDSILVHYSAVGTYEPDNVFVIQVSDGNGSFNVFRNAGTSKNSTDALFVKMPYGGAKYRVRVISSKPYRVSDDTGEELSVSEYPTPMVFCRQQRTLIGRATRWEVSQGKGDSKYEWRIPSSASASSTAGIATDITFSTPGTGFASVSEENASGCRGSSPNGAVTVLSCSPVIPSNARIVRGEESGTDSFVVVKAGGTYRALDNWDNRSQRVFVETGGVAVAEFRSEAIFYVMPGAALISNANQGRALAIFTDGAGLDFDTRNRPLDTLYCPNLSFAAASVSEARLLEATVVRTGRRITIRSHEGIAGVEVLDLLGRPRHQLESPGNAELSVDLATLNPGTYYLRITSARGARKVIKLAL